MLVAIRPRSEVPAHEQREIVIDLATGTVSAMHSLLVRLGLAPCLLAEHRCGSCPLSAYVTVTTVFRDEDCLVAALEEMGYEVERHAEAQTLYGHIGDARDERAHVIVRRKHVGSAANDVGWERSADTALYAGHISEYDRNCTFTPAKLRELDARYAKHAAIKTAIAEGYHVSDVVEEDGKIRLKLTHFA